MNAVKDVTKPKKRIFYFDALRALAIICVIMFHVFTRTRGFVAGDWPHLTLSWVMEDIMGNCFGIGVPLFLMLSGALSLGRVWDIKSFLKKRIPRILKPFIFWGIILSIFIILCSYLYPNVIDIVKSFDFNSIAHYIVNAFLSISRGFTPYWFFWMILGVYLIMPVFNKWLLHADLKEAEYFLFFCLIASIFDFTLKKDFPVELHYFTGPIIMVILGYYLRHTKRKIFDNLYVPIILIIVGIIGALYLGYRSSTTSTLFLIHRYSIFSLLEAAGVFLLFRNLSNVNININFFKNLKRIFRKSISSIAKYSYGIYLIHCPFLVIILCVLENLTDLTLGPIVLISFVVTLLLSWVVMALLNRVPYINKVIGAK